MSEGINPRIRDILDSVILYNGPNKDEGTTYCYLKYPDDSKKFVKYDDNEFFLSLSFCLGCTIDGNTVYCRSYKTKNDETIKFEKPFEITEKDVDNYLSFLSKTDRYLRPEAELPESERRSVSLLRDIVPYKKGSGDMKVCFFKAINDHILCSVAYEKFIEITKGISIDENQFFINHYIDINENDKQTDKPIVISRKCIELFCKDKL